MSEILHQWGVAGAIIVALAGYVLLIEKRHYKEREKWLSKMEQMEHDKNTAINNNTSVLAGLKTLLETLENIKRR
jgi:hypothetical protein